ncbi:hypothetical protein EYB26_006984 [Talaromyces marneffei]|uniref:uncharacterized protein n=1 Tax=Talaromyces marneffei TaxID=37727 RepID=UPI0012A8AC72|nr:uncharacterized protein EYB26_006984 [Talaromyces marneffei]QGA19295.1 hypothetical protein EYB26_006984 [Talaromyces marneffei]
MDILIYGDQTVDVCPFLDHLFKKKRTPLLQNFLERSKIVLQDEICRLSRTERVGIPQFSSLRGLVDEYQRRCPRVASLESALTCLAQLAHFIGLAEENPQYYIKKGSHIVGVCIGLLSASAIACSHSLVHLIPLAVETVRTAFRLGSCVGRMARLQEPVVHESKSWTSLVTGVDLQAVASAIHAFNRTQVELKQRLQNANKLYVSAVASNSTAVSGPPSVHGNFWEQFKKTQSFNHRDLPIYGPYHAPHLFTNVEDVLSEETLLLLDNFNQIRPVLEFTYSTSRELFEHSIGQILQESVDWNTLVKSCSSTIIDSACTSCRVLAFGAAATGNALCASLKGSVGDRVNLSLEDGSSWLHANHIAPHLASKPAGCNIAIVGMAGRFPNSADHEAYWDLLSQGLDVHRVIPPDRFDAAAHTDPSGNGRNKSHTPYGCFIEDAALFDPRFFSMSPREAKQTDPMQRLAIVTAYEAMESAGFVMNRTPSTQANRIGTFYGQTSDDWREINAAENIDTYFITGGVRAFGPGRINYHFGFSGPSFSIDTACSSSFAAIQLACTSLRAGDCDTVFAGGMNILTNPDIFAGLSKGQFLSKTGSCKTFDNDADGYCRGEGVATVILKRIEDAIADNDPILGVIRGTATNHSAEAVSITHPHAGAQQFLFQNIMDDLAVDPRLVDYVEMHGTGTQAGDGIEIQSVTDVFAPRGARRRAANQPLFIGSAKANIGHGEAVSGVSALIKSLLMFQKNLIPPHCGIKGTLNRTFPADLKERGVNIATRLTPFPVPQETRKKLIFINNFSAAGGNSAMLLEDAPDRVISGKDNRRFNVVTVSAKSLASFQGNLARLLSWVEGNTEIGLSDLAYTTTARRQHFIYRKAFSIDTMLNLRQSLQSYMNSKHIISPILKTSPNVVFMFTGQGAQYSTMGKRLFEESESFRKQLIHLDQIVLSEGLPSFLGAIDGSSEDALQKSPVVSQVATTCLQIALVDLWKSWGVVPSAVVGHSLGEYAALYGAGILSQVDAVLLVARRAYLLESLCTMNSHTMLAVKGLMSSDELLDITSTSEVEIACINSPIETVLAGPSDAIEEVSTRLAAKRSDLQVIKLKVPFAFHSAQVEPILEEFEKLAQSVVFHPPQVPVLSPCLSTTIDRPNVVDASYLRRHCRNTVDFIGAINTGIDSGVVTRDDLWLELGPHPVCSNLARSILGDITALPSLHKKEDAWKTVTSSMSRLYESGVSIAWNEFHHSVEKATRVLKLPSYAFDSKVFWLDYTNNWTLTKGSIDDNTTGTRNSSPAFSTSSIHRIVEEIVDANSAVVTAEADLHDPHLKAIITGHKVGGAPLFPSSINADMAYTLSKYAFERLHPGTEEFDVNICNMQSSSPLILDMTRKSQILQIEAEIVGNEKQAKITFQSKQDGKPVTKYAECVVYFEDPKMWAAEFKRSAYLVNARIRTLQAPNAGIHKIHRGMAYKLFSALVDYSDTFRGMEEVRLDSENLEAIARIKFRTSSKDGTFLFNPYFIDNTCHISGFIMNATDAVDSTNQVYISHGWETMRFVRKPSIDKEYYSYVKMSFVSEHSTMVSGDVYVLEGTEIIGVFGGVRFQGVPRKLMPTLLGLESKSPSVSNTISEKPYTKNISAMTKNPTPKVNKPLQVASQAAAGAEPGVPMLSKALDILVSEIGCSMSELNDNVEFEDLGVDSLMSLSISSRLREELDIAVGGTLFIDYGSVGQLKAYLSQFEEATDNTGFTKSNVSSSVSSFMTPEDSESDSSVGSDEDDPIYVIRSTIAEEMGMDILEIHDSLDLSQIGMDSLMSLSILGTLREKTGTVFPPDFLIENTTIEQIKISLHINEPKKKPTGPSSNVMRIGTEDLDHEVQKPTSIKKTETFDLSSYPPAQVVLLSGNLKAAKRKLFVLPDGSGAAFSYAAIPPLDDETVVYGLNCPFMRTPDEFTIGVPAVTKIYIDAIKTRQPEGPYLLAGWSAGGVLAYEMTRQLIQRGEKVENLILIDSPYPIKLEALPPVFHQFCNEIGLLGDGKSKPPSWLLPHFRATVRELTAYSEILESTEIDTSDMPPTTLIWARDGVVKNPGDPKPTWEEGVRMPNSMEWLVKNRYNLGDNGWKLLVGKGKTRCVSMDGNHFTMMRDPLAAEVGRLVKEALDWTD